MKGDVVAHIIKQAIEASHNAKESGLVVKTIEITKWEECGEFNGDDPRPILKIEFFESFVPKP